MTTNPSDAVIETSALTKRYDDVTALDRIDWRVHRGSITGLIGPNGAGKSTLLKTMLGIVHPTSGSGTVLGSDVVRDSARIRQDVAFVPEDKLVYHRMRVEQFLNFYGSFFASWNARVMQELLHRWSIPLKRPIRDLSKGTRAKLMLAAAFARQPKVLLMDEPTLDLDPASVEDVCSVFAQWVTLPDRTIVLSTHRMDEVERICDDVTIMDAGRVIAGGNLDDLRSRWKTIRITGSIPATAVDGWPETRHVRSQGAVTFLVVEGDAELVVDKLRRAGSADVETLDMNLRSIYLTATGYHRGRLDDILEIMV